MFGEHGIHGASTRQLAQAAGVNAAAIAYYFGGKDGYYLAVARHLVECYATPLRELAQETQRRLSEAPLDAAADRVLLEQVLTTFARMLLLRLDEAHVANFVLREQLQPTEAFDVLYEGIIRPVHETLTLLVSRLTGVAGGEPLAILRAHAVLGQVLAFEAGRATVLRRLQWKAYTCEQIEQIARLAAEFACRALDASHFAQPIAGPSTPAQAA